MLGMKAAQRTPAPSPAPAAAALAKIDERLNKLEASIPVQVADVLRRESRGEHKNIDVDPTNATKIAALKLVAGSDAAPEQTNGYLDAVRSLEATREAVSILSAHRGDAAVRAAAERFQAHKAEYDDAMRQVALCVISLERAQQAVDVIVRKVGAQFDLPGQGHVLLGRMWRNETVIHRYLEQAAKLGFITVAEFNHEVRRAADAQPK
jgi:hypothetical protein